MGTAYEDAALFGIRDIVDGVDAREYGLFCAVPSPTAPDDVLREPLDGDNILTNGLSRFTIRPTGDKKEAVIDVDRISGRVLITNSRVAVACSKFDKSGDWTSLTGLAGKAMAARRGKGKMLVSHVRYPWLAGVYARNRDGLGSSEMIRLVVDMSSSAKVRFLINLHLPKHTDAVSLASKIIRRASSFRLENEPDLDDPERAEYREQLLEYSELPELVYQRKSDRLSGVSFIQSRPVDSKTAVILGTGMTEVPQVSGGFKGFKAV